LIKDIEKNVNITETKAKGREGRSIFLSLFMRAWSLSWNSYVIVESIMIKINILTNYF